MKRGRSRRQVRPSEASVSEPVAPAAPRPRPAPASPAAASALGPDLPLAPAFARLPRWLVPPVAARAWPLGWFLLALGAVWVVGSLVRLGWLMDFGWATEAVQWQGTPFLTSADAYYFAAGVQAALTGDAQGRSRIPAPEDHALVALGWLVGKLTSLSPDTIALYTPVVLAPAIAAPLAFIGRTVGRGTVGLVAALAVVVAPGYYLRSVAGYFDTDTFSVTIPLVAVACLVSAVVRPSLRPGPGIAAAAVLAAYPFFYDQGHPLGLLTAVVAIAYLGLFHRRDPWTWPLVGALGLSQLDLHWLWLVPLVVAAALVLHALAARVLTRLAPRRAAIARVALPIAVALVGVLGSEGWAAAVKKLQLFTGGAAERAAEVVASDADGPVDEGPVAPVFQDSTRFVAEAQKLPLADLGRRVLGDLALSLLAGAGMLLGMARQRALLLLAPLAGLGLFSIIGGLRFTIFLSPVAALGVGWVVALLAGLARPRFARAGLGLALGVAVAVPGWLVVDAARLRPSIVRPEVEALDALRQRLQPGDVVVSWWDYGYAISYFAHARTVVDGGRRHEDTNLVAEMLLGTSQRAAANLARLTVDALDQGAYSTAHRVFGSARRRGIGSGELLASLERPDAQVPHPASAIYFYLPARMLTILPAIDLLRPREPGHKRPPLRGARPLIAKAEGERLALPRGGVVDGKTMTIRSAAQAPERKLKRIYSVAGGGGKPVEVRSRDGAPEAPTNGLFIRNTGLFAEMDDRLVASNFVQLFAFEKADPAHFELVFANEAAKIYRLR